MEKIEMLIVNFKNENIIWSHKLDFSVAIFVKLLLHFNFLLMVLVIVLIYENCDYQLNVSNAKLFAKIMYQSCKLWPMNDSKIEK